MGGIFRCSFSQDYSPRRRSKRCINSQDSRFFPPKLIVDWQQLEDYPDWYEIEGFDHKLYDDYIEDFPIDGDKLAGWPLWIQGNRYPNCPICSERMRLVFQVDSQNNNLPYMFGPDACGYITQCKHHKN